MTTKLQKCYLQAVDPKVGKEIKAKFNPTELSVDRSMSWSDEGNKSETSIVEFTKAAPKSLSVELLFDTYEERKNVYDLYIKPIEALTEVVKVGDARRPPICLFHWGQFPGFVGAIESLAIKYTMFFSDGRPCRATCSIKMIHVPTDAGKAALKRAEQRPASSPAGTAVQHNETLRADKAGPNHRQTLEQSGSDDGRLTPGEPFGPGGAPNPDFLE